MYPVWLLAPSSFAIRSTSIACSFFGTDAARRYKKVANAAALIWKSLTIAEKKIPGSTHPSYWSK